MPALVARAKAAACKHLNVPDADSFSFMSVTAGLFGALGAVKLEEGDVIITTDVVYHSVMDTVKHLCAKHNVQHVCITAPTDVSSASILASFQTCVSAAAASTAAAGRRVKLAVFDHISSKPSILFPVKDMVAVCQRLSIPTLIDGAQSPGTLGFDVWDVDPTFFCTTFHKWCHAPRPSGGIFVNMRQLNDKVLRYSDWIDVSRLVVNGGWDQSGDSSNLYVDASKPSICTDTITQGIYDESTRDYGSIVTLPLCFALARTTTHALLDHAKMLKQKAVTLLKKLWGLTDSECHIWTACDTDEAKSIPVLSLPLPTQLLLDSVSSERCGDEQAKLKYLKRYVNSTLWERFAIECPVFIWQQATLAVRISLPLYVQLQDVEALGKAVLRLAAECCGTAKRARVN